MKNRNVSALRLQDKTEGGRAGIKSILSKDGTMLQVQSHPNLLPPESGKRRNASYPRAVIKIKESKNRLKGTQHLRPAKDELQRQEKEGLIFD